MKRLSLRVYVIVLFVVAVLLVTVLSTAFGISQASAGIRDSLIARQRDAGTGAANSIATLFDSSRLSLSSTASLITSGDLRSPREDLIGPVLDPLVAFSREFSTALLLDPTGRVVVARPPGPQFRNATFADEPAFEQAAATHAAALALPGAPRRPFWITQVPSTIGTGRPYFLMGIMDTNVVENILWGNIDQRDQAILLTQDGLVIASTNPDYAPDAFAAWGALQRLRQGASSVEEAKAPVGGDEVILTASSLEPKYAATVAVMSPRTQIETLQARLIGSAVITSLALAAGAILLGVVAANAITQPLEDVRTATRRMREGDLTVRATPRGARELQDLASDFNSMAATLASEWEQRVQLQSHLEELVSQRTRELDQKREEMELFFYGVSHDFKSPIISISNLTQLVEEGLGKKHLDRDELRALANRIRRSSLNLQSLILELLEFAQAGRVAPKLEPVRVAALVQNVMDEAKDAAAEKRIKLEVHGKPLTIRSDPERLRHILTNLVENSIKYMPGRTHPWVRVSWVRQAGYLVLTVADNGAGIPETVQPSLFRPFSRHAPAGARATGAGLGLSIVKRLTDSLSGNVELKSQLGSGTTFTLRVPLAPPTNAGRPPP